MTSYQYFSDRNRTDQHNATQIHTSFGSKKLCRHRHRDGRDRTFCKTPSLG